ncbi:hypothetical protein DINM_000002, partial [Dirofilaria immitis]|nr:hypothetical protein [Dirofilaria immitis]
MNNVEFDEAGECSNNQSHGPRERMILKGKIYIAKINEAGEYLKRLDEVTKCLSVMNLTNKTNNVEFDKASVDEVTKYLSVMNLTGGNEKFDEAGECSDSRSRRPRKKIRLT